MSDKEKQGAEIPARGLFVVLVLLLGLFAFPDQPYKSSRQAQDASRPHLSIRSHVEARLWEDPFTVRERVPSGQNSGDESDFGRVLLETGSTSPHEIAVLSIMVPGGGYSENIESRRKCRYAVLSALSERGYYPDSSDRLHFFSYDGGLIPYESFSFKYSRKRHIFTVWLNEYRFQHNPLAKLGSFIGAVKKAVHYAEGIKFKVLGPGFSTTLKAIIDESNGYTKIDNPALADVAFFCWGATAGEDYLLEGTKFTSMQDAMADIPTKIYRPIATDDQLMHILVAELRLRGIDPSTDHVALVSEWDTLYGRALPKAFVDAAVQERYSGQNVHRFHYMRGIDGQTAKVQEVEKKAETPAQGGKKDNRKEEIERPFGNSQYDYLRRLSKQLKSLDLQLRDQSKNLKAIGVLGLDVYDKLLILQAMADLFPQVIFFTTDIDARYFHPSEQGWSRNLIIVSAFGLKLPCLQERTPPFRDSYQTSLFFSTVLSVLETDLPHDPVCLSTILPTPKVFELGRSGVSFELLPPSQPISSAVGQASTCGIREQIWGYCSPDTPSPILTQSDASILTLPAATAAFLIAILVFSICCWDTERGSAGKLVAAIVIVSGIMALKYILVEIVEKQQAGGEPFELFEGISVWPTVCLRMFALLLSVYFMGAAYACCRTLKKDIQLSEFPCIKGCKPSQGVFKSAFEHGATLGSQALRIAVLVILYSFLCIAIISAFGGFPFTPYRGGSSKMACDVSLFLSVASFLILLFYVIDITGAAVSLVNRIAARSEWPDDKREKTPFGREEFAKEAFDFIRIGLIVKVTTAVNKLIYYPIIVVIILGVSRLPYLDKWDTPLGLLLVILLGLALSISCSIRLRRTAERVRKTILDRIWFKQVRISGGEETGPAEQIKLFAEYIRNIKGGAFVPLFEQPWVRATLIFITSGGIAALPYLPWFQ